MRFLTVFVLTFFIHTAQAGPFTRHLEQAMKLNKQRMLPYMKWTNGKSKYATKGLIAFEIAILPLAYYYDKQAKKWNEQGVPVLQYDFVEMSQTPPLPTTLTPHPEWPREISKLPIGNLIKELKSAYKVGGIMNFHEKVIQHISDLAPLAGRYCLVRHFLESVGRSAILLPRYFKYVEDAQDREKLEKLIWNYIKWQLFGLRAAIFLDHRAYSIQRSGVPIYCQDVPYIDPWARDISF